MVCTIRPGRCVVENQLDCTRPDGATVNIKRTCIVGINFSRTVRQVHTQHNSGALRCLSAIAELPVWFAVEWPSRSLGTTWLQTNQNTKWQKQSALCCSRHLSIYRGRGGRSRTSSMH